MEVCSRLRTSVSCPGSFLPCSPPVGQWNCVCLGDECWEKVSGLPHAAGTLAIGLVMISPDLIVQTTVYLPSVLTALLLKLNGHMLLVTVTVSGKLQTLHFQHFLLLSANYSGETGKGYLPAALSCLDPLSYTSALHFQRVLSEHNVGGFFPLVTF